MRLPARFLCLLLAVTGTGVGGNAGSPVGSGDVLASGAKPRLFVDTGGHTAKVRDIRFTADGRQLVSGGYDKIVRVWDIESGQTVRTIRGEVGDGLDGAIYALDLSPDNRLLAVAGRLPGLEPEDQPVRIHDFRTGDVLRLLSDHDNVILDLAFGPEGRRLVSAGADARLVVWDTETGEALCRLTGHEGPVLAVGVSTDGQYAVSGGVDGVLRVWRLGSGDLVRELPGHEGSVLAVAFSPDGRLLASGGQDGTVRLWDAASWEPMRPPKSEKPLVLRQESEVTSLSPSPDGLLLTGAGEGAGYYATVFDTKDGSFVNRTAYDNVVLATAISPDGRIAALAGGDHDAIYLRDLETGVLRRRLTGGGGIVWSVGFAENGESIAYGNLFDETSPKHYLGPLRKTIRLKIDGEYGIGLGEGLEGDAASRYLQALERQGDYALRTRDGPTGFQGVLQVLRSDELLYEIERDKTTGYRHRSYGFTHRGDRFVSGGSNGVLTVFDTETGKQIEELVGHTGDVYAVAIAADDRTLISGSGDGTIRLWDLDSGENLLTVFVSENDDEWIAWTRSGYYASSLHGDRYIGWHINQGPARAVEYYQAQQFQQELYRPDVIALLLKTRNLEEALNRANRARGGRFAEKALEPLESVAQIVPPFLHVEPHARDTFSVEEAVLPVKAVAKSYNWPITEVRVELNGALVLSRPFADPEDPETLEKLEERVLELELDLREGENLLKVIAYHGKGASEPEIRKVIYKPATPPEEIKPNLVLVAVGVSEYSDNTLRLEYASKDARVVAGFFEDQRGGLFGDVQVKILLDGQATRGAIVKALNWLERTGTQTDVRVLFVSGHGVLDHKGEYFFLPVDHVPGDDPNVNGVGSDRLYDPLVHIPGKKVLMLDTCRAGGVAGTRYKGARVDMTRVLKELNSDNAGLVTYAASTSRELSVEKPEWGHGAFTEALRRGLTGSADGFGGTVDGVIYIHELGSWIIEKVRELTEGRQHAVFDSPPDTPPFPLFLLPEAGPG